MGQTQPSVTRVLAKPPAGLRFKSLSELYEQYCSLFVGREFRCPLGRRVIFLPRHFFHLVKLKKGTRIKFTIEDEEPLIRATITGFGEYEVDENRSRGLAWIPEILAEPHEIWEYEKKKTADEVFIREYDKSGSPFRVLLILREDEHLLPITCMSVRRTGIKEHRRGRKLWPPKGRSHPG
jgi:phage-Barnase-EndoU-ColicinE5/D-RelE like nuclease2